MCLYLPQLAFLFSTLTYRMLEQGLDAERHPIMSGASVWLIF